MQIADFVRVYQTKSDEELIQFAISPEQLTSEARLALQGELSRRSISITDNSEVSEVSQHDGDGHDVRIPIPSGRLRLQMRDVQDKAVGDFVAEVLRTYRNHFWLFFKITSPAVLISTIAIITARSEVREISLHLPRGYGLLAHRTEILEMELIGYVPWIVTWIAFCFVFGATCIAMEESEGGFTPSALRSFLNIRDRLRPFLRLCLLLMVLMLVVDGAAPVLLANGALWVSHQLRVRIADLLIWGLSYGLAGLGLLVMSRFFLAIPAVILDDCSVGQAMFRSDKLTQGKWLTLATLLAKSVIGGYIAANCPFWAASFIHVVVPLPWWFPWVLTIASIICVTVVEPTMFVGFALLYLKMAVPDAAPGKVLTPQLT